MKEDLLFLSLEWVHEVTKVVQGSIAKALPKNNIANFIM
jgi:hypothetical protein